MNFLKFYVEHPQKRDYIRTIMYLFIPNIEKHLNIISKYSKCKNC